MKKITALFLCFAMALGITACGGKGGDSPNGSSEEATLPAEKFMEPVAYKENHYYMKDLDGCIKRLGRTQYKDNELTCDWSGTGILFKVYTEGEAMVVGYHTNYDTYFTVYVDGEEVSRELFQGKGNFRLKLEPGTHEISITKENEIEIAQNTFCRLTELTFKGKFYERPADKERFIEAIGDSITCGDGAAGVFVQGKLWSVNEHSAYASFAAVVARHFDADYELISRGGIGILRSRDEVGLPMPKIYEYISPYSDRENKYDFARKPDMILFELGSNDNAEICTEEDYYEALCTFLDRVLELNGRDVPVVWTGKNMGHYESALRYKEAHPEVNFNAFQYDYGTSGAAGAVISVTGHPNIEEQREYGDALSTYIESLNIFE